MLAVAEHSYDPNEPETELAFEAGEQLLILNYGDPNPWLRALKNGRVGLVPENYLKIQRPSWYLGRISRAAAEQVLSSCHQGAFLVRLSESSPTDFSLSVNCTQSVQHFRILTDENYNYFLWKRKFTSLNELIDYYRTETVSRNNNIFLSDMLAPGEFIVEAKYDFTATQDAQDDELGFRKGDLIIVTDNHDEHWWSGKMGGNTGFFPQTYVYQNDFLHLNRN